MFSYRCYSITWLLDLLGCRHCMAPSRSSLRLKSWDESDSSLIHWSLQKYSELYSYYKVIQKYNPLEIADLHSDPNKSKNIDQWCRVSVQILILLLDHFTGRSSMSTRVDLMSPSRTETWENETSDILKGAPSRSAASMPDWKIEMLQCQLSHKRPTGYFISTSCWIEDVSCVPCFPTSRGLLHQTNSFPVAESSAADIVSQLSFGATGTWEPRRQRGVPARQLISHSQHEP